MLPQVGRQCSPVEVVHVHAVVGVRRTDRAGGPVDVALTRRRLDLDHAGSHVRQHHRAERPRDRLLRLDDRDARLHTQPAQSVVGVGSSDRAELGSCGSVEDASW